MIYTGCYEHVDKYIEEGLHPISLIRNETVWSVWEKLMPAQCLLDMLQDETINTFTFTETYKQQLDMLDTQLLQCEFKKLDNPIFLGYAESGFCPRHVLADWLEDKLKIKVDEYKL